MTLRRSLELERDHLMRHCREKLARSQATTSLAERSECLSELRRVERRVAEIQDRLDHLPEAAT